MTLLVVSVAVSWIIPVAESWDPKYVTVPIMGALRVCRRQSSRSTLLYRRSDGEDLMRGCSSSKTGESRKAGKDRRELHLYFG